VFAAPNALLKAAVPVRRYAAVGALAHNALVFIFAVLTRAGLPAHYVVKFPNLSPTMKTGNLMAWKVKVG
jgi:hypothetical protein